MDFYLFVKLVLRKSEIIIGLIVIEIIRAICSKFLTTNGVAEKACERDGLVNIRILILKIYL